MRTVKYTNSFDFQCLEDLRETFMEISLVHMGKETCRPFHAFSGTRDEYIIHFILEGRGIYSAGGNTYALDLGQMFLIYPDEPVIYCADEKNPWTYAWIGFKGLKSDVILKNCGFSSNRLVLPAPAPDVYMDCFDELFEHVTLNFSSELYRESILLKLLAILADHHAHLVLENRHNQTGRSDNAYVNLAIDYIGKMYMQNIKVTDIADSIGITRSHLNSIFQNELNISIQKFLIEFRMHKAASLLVSTTMSIKEIADQVGYNDQLTFSKAFKNKFGMSPKSYRTYKDELETRKSRPQ